MDVKAGQFEALPAGAEPVAHNSVLIRTREPRDAMQQWLVPVLLVATIAAGAGTWFYLGTHHATPLVNHAVATTDGPAYQTGG
ncbi:MAG TPA: hypothetical protein VGL58_09020 [Caulobacteraceae bacterium]|jgi:hypothetical protein